MEKFTIRVDNTPRVLEDLKESVERALVEIGIKAQRYAQDLCPVGTPESTGIKNYMGGTLRQSIAYATAHTQGHTTTVTGSAKNGARKTTKKASFMSDSWNKLILGTNVYYAVFVEKGHRQQPGRFVPAIGKRLKKSFVAGRPFLKPALADHADEWKNIIKANLSH